MKKKVFAFIMLVCVMFLSGCTNKYAKEFKNDYESLNGIANKKGAMHRSVEIPEDNPFEKVSAEEIVKKIENYETFYVYFGDKLCPWCRSVIEKSIEVAKENNIKKIYYVAIWDDEGNEILRDKYKEVETGKLEKEINGTEAYYKLLTYFDSLLSDYTITGFTDYKVDTGEKRIYAPNFIYVENGVAKKLVSGISSKQNGSRDELTEEILKEEEEIFKEFFQN